MRKTRIAPALVLLGAGLRIASVAFAGDSDPSDRLAVVAQAKALIEKGEGKKAIDLLEPLCLDASKEERPKIVPPLLLAYRLEITRALTDGRKQDADEFQRLEKILTRPQKRSSPAALRPSPSGAKSPATLPIPSRIGRPQRPSPDARRPTRRQSSPRPIPSRIRSSIDRNPERLRPRRPGSPRSPRKRCVRSKRRRRNRTNQGFA